MRLPQYPQTRPIDAQDKPVFDLALKSDPAKISEYTFTNIFAWRAVYEFEICLLNGFLIVCSKRAGRKDFFYPIGKGDVKGTVLFLLKEKNSRFIRVPADIAALFEKETDVAVELDNDNSDYVYRAQDLIRLPGRRYDGKRNLIKRFRTSFQYSYLELNRDNIEKCIQFQDEWCRSMDCEKDKNLLNEAVAIKEILENFFSFNLTGAFIELGGKIVAVAVGEPLNGDTFVIHILKAARITGLYQTMNNEFISKETAAFTFVNMEQDLGVPGLRKSKLSYHPVDMVKKYILTSIRPADK